MKICICEQVSDLVCINCIHSRSCFDYLYCRLSPPKSDNEPSPKVYWDHTCSHGMWYCKLTRSLEDSPGPPISHRVSGKVAAISNFLDRERERSDDLPPINDDRDVALRYLLKRLSSVAEKNFLGPRHKELIGQMRSLRDVDIVCNSVSIIGNSIEFAIRTEFERAE